MTNREKLVQEVEMLPDSMVETVLEFVQSLKQNDLPEGVNPKVWEAYLASEQEREEVYRRLADS
ncbi:DUF2281 domain-containing protein [Thermoleptolyngbya oregonensis NK1-22]|uniref:DUF2281 domain-containing protein n=1 Tax=Thermoleptolyngbya oregonensis NK1-22 TaxID=2547457 RepID=A0AA96YBQ3_9CYAN|nr:hypothetical protein [Thermoleptolyngbya oregonensis]WOB45453.1 DUF2281 domain-containing protein [Thermoleptolyngbya oregonensis NK1-22]